MLLGIGVDVVHLPRIAAISKKYNGHKFASRILSKRELKQWNCLRDTSERRQIQFLAVRHVVYLCPFNYLTTEILSDGL